MESHKLSETEHVRVLELSQTLQTVGSKYQQLSQQLNELQGEVIGLDRSRRDFVNYLFTAHNMDPESWALNIQSGEFVEKEE